MIPVILPWREMVLPGRVYNFASKINLSAYYLVFAVLVTTVFATFMLEVRDAVKRGRKCFVRIAVRKWWVNY